MAISGKRGKSETEKDIHLGRRIKNGAYLPLYLVKTDKIEQSNVVLGVLLSDFDIYLIYRQKQDETCGFTCMCQSLAYN